MDLYPCLISQVTYCGVKMIENGLWRTAHVYVSQRV